MMSRMESLSADFDSYYKVPKNLVFLVHHYKAKLAEFAALTNLYNQQDNIFKSLAQLVDGVTPALLK